VTPASRAAIALGLWTGLLSVAALAVTLFVSAGRLGIAAFWAYVGLWGVAAVVGPLIVDPDLIRERLRPGPGGRDYLTGAAFIAVWLVQHVLAGLDVGRFHWSDGVPALVQAAALATVAAALAVMMWAMAVNRFFSSVIRLQTERGHRVVTGGPYRFVRHPAYAAGLPLFVAAGLALGSWLAALVGALFVPLIVRRTAAEDLMLRERLDGYAAYAATVRSRLVPGVW
jgi:protein-S-isoprenylcysteine O-methyltransferase Ste14